MPGELQQCQQHPSRGRVEQVLQGRRRGRGYLACLRGHVAPQIKWQPYQGAVDHVMREMHRRTGLLGDVAPQVFKWQCLIAHKALPRKSYGHRPSSNEQMAEVLRSNDLACMSQHGGVVGAELRQNLSRLGVQLQHPHTQGVPLRIPSKKVPTAHQQEGNGSPAVPVACLQG